MPIKRHTPCILAVIFLFASWVCALSQAPTQDAWSQWSLEQHGTLQALLNADSTRKGGHIELKRTNAAQPIHLAFSNVQALGIDRDKQQWWVLPLSEKTPEIIVNDGVWILPASASSQAQAWYLQLHGGHVRVSQNGGEVKVDADLDRAAVDAFEARPHSDVFAHRFSVVVDGKHDLENALAGFYWGTMLPLVVERTMAANFEHSDGYVLSTLMLSKYSGTYPAVDHEFQIAGRLAMGSPLDLDIVRRMIELQFRLMREDPEHLYRAPCSLQQDGHAEYYIRRNSVDNKENATMFPLTGDIEVMGEAWQYYAMSNDLPWLRAHIEDLEHAAGWTLAHIDPYGRLWSDVYYEDQVIKDGRETEAQAFAAHSFHLLSKMEARLGRQAKAQQYAATEQKLAAALVRPLPDGFWDAKQERFTDWVDRLGVAHDHIHLAANTTPVSFGYATAAQAAAVQRMVQANDAEFERFPTFVAAHVEAYSKSEMGVAGPYDLSAAGRYWFWDAAYRAGIRDSATLLQQLNTVAAEAAKDNYFMGERYDMDHVYYVDGKNAHGAVKYFEYPNVFANVLMERLLGINRSNGGIALTPNLNAFAHAEFTTPQYALRYDSTPNGFSVTNLSSRSQSFQVNLRGLGNEQRKFHLVGLRTTADKDGTYTLMLAPGENVTWKAL
ncbi:hypothetical protein [Terriglobus sp. TAA 43]|uniref:hypothetical protein n=1 Tax=Terriglobus sp. TAA 43 TaxID=278961 RepID=UPI00068E3CCE|nr:hypothetical protein [Terriglobus sp. TAA 43]